MFSGTPPLDSPPPSDEPQRRRPEIERERERTGGRRLGPVVCVSVRRSAFWSSGSCLYPTSFPVKTHLFHLPSLKIDIDDDDDGQA
ncbi:hypothetical protein HanHA89_Chr15g0628071 [Helianthus annuus]|nr:hypothetical protein HanHA89_Chr15g0628071 [Helianthus annuus]